MGKNRWTVSKSVLEEIKKNEVKDSFSFILSLYLRLREIEGLKSTIQYKNFVNTLGNNNEIFKTEAEQHFTTLLPKLIASGRTGDVIKLIGLIRNSVCRYKWDKKRSYKSYVTTFIDFLESFINSTSKNNKEIVDIIKKAYNQDEEKLSDEEESYLKVAFSEREIFLHNRLYTKFKSRLRCQDRISGDKVWLPLRYIAKLYKKCGIKDIFSEWLNSLVDGIYIHYEDNYKNLKSVPFKTDVFLDLEKNKEGKFEVYVIWTKVQEPKWFRVYTPTGNGNEKTPMTVKNISEIDIDHVKPIDLTLRELENAGRIPMLIMVSDSYKKLQEDISEIEKYDSQLEKDALDTLSKDSSFEIDKLTEELDLIRKDGILRLMDSKLNSSKSNGSTFTEIRKVDEKYKGIMLTGIISDDEEDCELTIYQDLSKNGETHATREPIKEKGRKVKITKQIIDLL